MSPKLHEILERFKLMRAITVLDMLCLAFRFPNFSKTIGLCLYLPRLSRSRLSIRLWRRVRRGLPHPPTSLVCQRFYGEMRGTRLACRQCQQHHQDNLPIPPPSSPAASSRSWCDSRKPVAGRRPSQQLKALNVDQGEATALVARWAALKVHCRKKPPIK